MVAVLTVHADPPSTPPPHTYPHIPPALPLVAGSRNTAVLADRAGGGGGGEEEEERGREEERGKMMGWGGMGVSVPHAGVLTGNVGKQN